MDILKEVRSVYSYMVERRRWYHTWPELSGKEEKTAASICEELDRMGIRYTAVPNGGVLGFIDGASEGKTVLLRADMDALPIQESESNLKQKRSCRSRIDGVSMMCGHDSHMAMLLGAARVLSQHTDEIAGRIILMFERGEEGLTRCTFSCRFLFPGAAALVLPGRK